MPAKEIQAMRAVGYHACLPIEDEQALVDLRLPKPSPKGRELLVKIRAVSVNPVDAKMRLRSAPSTGETRVLDWDAVGVVVSVGSLSRLFEPGDMVFYAGELGRPGTNAEFHIVDERLVGRKPETLSDAEAAALPLTAITAWEVLFDRLEIRKPVAGAGNAIVIIGGAGGVGSMAIQLATALTNTKVIASASRPETQDWVRRLGADHVIDHNRPMAPQIAKLGLGMPAFVFSTTHTDRHYDDIVEFIAPQGRLVLIDDPEPIDAHKLKRKSISLHWELMFTRSLFETADMAEQGRLLNEVSVLVDNGKISTTLSHHFGTICAANLKRAHALIESGTAIGKIVLEGF